MKKAFVNSLVAGAHVDEVFFVRESALRTSKTGSLYMDAALADRTGSIPTKLWQVKEDARELLKKGSYVRVRGRVESYRNTLQLILDDISPVPEESVDASDYHAASERDIGEMREELNELVGSVKGPALRKLLEGVFEEAFLEEFSSAPAASQFHHAYRGGLLEHTCAVARAAREYGKLDERVDADLLLAGALLHDIGKAKELACLPSPDYTDEGRLLGHVFLGAAMLDRAIEKAKDFPNDLRLRLVHVVLSHHGTHEFGSPVLPATPEALALHHLDNIDAKVQAASRAADTDASEGNWTEYVKMLSARVFKKKSV